MHDSRPRDSQSVPGLAAGAVRAIRPVYGVPRGREHVGGPRWVVGPYRRLREARADVGNSSGTRESMRAVVYEEAQAFSGTRLELDRLMDSVQTEASDLI
ncbi:hypothetical protein ACLOJK_008699 [Asimina triloba]